MTNPRRPRARLLALTLLLLAVTGLTGHAVAATPRAAAFAAGYCTSTPAGYKVVYDYNLVQPPNEGKGEHQSGEYDYSRNGVECSWAKLYPGALSTTTPVGQAVYFYRGHNATSQYCYYDQWYLNMSVICSTTAPTTTMSYFFGGDRNDGFHVEYWHYVRTV